MATLSFGPFTLAVSERLLTKGGIRIELGARALDILIALVSTPNEVVSKKNLMSRVWPDVTVEEGSLRFHMASLRKAAAWMIDHDARSQEMIARVFAGQIEGLSRDDVLDNVTLYWLTNTAISSARLYWDNVHPPTGGFFDVRGIKIPVAVSAYPDEIYQAPRSWAEKAYPKLIHYNKLPKGGHFAAWEQPASFVSEMRASFKSLRQPT